jgi:hypothetical protein
VGLVFVASDLGAPPVAAGLATGTLPAAGCAVGAPAGAGAAASPHGGVVNAVRALFSSQSFCFVAAAAATAGYAGFRRAMTVFTVGERMRRNGDG